MFICSSKAVQVVFRSFFERRSRVLSNTHPYNTIIVSSFDVSYYYINPIIVEAHPVDHRTVQGQAEEPRSRVAGLRLTGHRADLDVPEAERPERVDADAVLVEARREAEGVPEPQSHRLDRSPRHVRHPPGHGRRGPDRPERRVALTQNLPAAKAGYREVHLRVVAGARYEPVQTQLIGQVVPLRGRHLWREAAA